MTDNPDPDTVWSPTADLFDKLRDPGPTRDVMAEVFELHALLNTISLMASRLNPTLDPPTIAYATAELRNAADRLRMAITQLEGLRPLTQERTQWEPGNDTPAMDELKLSPRASVDDVAAGLKAVMDLAEIVHARIDELAARIEALEARK